jgi:aminoglycoside phosphotransferase (APT) family kinase protein
LDHRLPPAEVRVEVELVRRLLESQHPDLRREPLTLVDEGWDNFTFRAGPDLAVRCPRREAAVALLLHEQRWLPVIAPWLDLAVPVPVTVGEPTPFYPWPWSVVEWIPGTTAEGASLSARDAETLGRALRSLHRAAPADAPTNPFRGVPLAARAAVVEERLDRLELPQLHSIWKEALEAPPAQGLVWIHGDLHPRNVVLRDEALVGLIDWGDMAGGDPATDLAAAWMLFDRRARATFLEAYDLSGAQAARARGWAVNFGTAQLDSGEPRHVGIGRRILRELADG